MRDWFNHFRQVWPFDNSRRALAADCIAIGAQHKHFLTDLALRGGVYSPALPAKDLFEAGINEGQRRLALETIRLCKNDPDVLWGLVNKASDFNKREAPR